MKAAAAVAVSNNGDEPPAPPPSVGARLKDARRAQGLTQDQAAAELGVSRRTIYEWEADVRLPHSTLPQLAALYDVPVTVLLYGVEPASEELAALRQDVTALTVAVQALAAATDEAFRELRRLAEERLTEERLRQRGA